MTDIIRHLEEENKDPKTITAYKHTIDEFAQWHFNAAGEYNLKTSRH